MKTVFVIAGLLIAFFQAGSSEPTEITLQVRAAIDLCVTQLNLDKKETIIAMNEDVVPEDDSKIELFDCFTNALGVKTEDGGMDFEKFLPLLQDMLKQKMGNVDDVDAKALHIATAAIEHCKDTPHADSFGLTAIKIRNCIKAFSQKPQHH